MITKSPSQIDTYLDCPRKWALRYIENIPVVQPASAALGTEVHSQLEKYFGSQSKPLDYTSDAGYIAGEMLSHLPMPMERGVLQVEHEFVMQSDRHHYHGLIDLRDPTTFTIYDHKTTSNLRWAKTPEQLLYDPQAVIYATTSLVDWHVPVVHLQWTYSQTRGARRCLPVVQDITVDHAAMVFDEIELVADEMDALRANYNRDLVPQHPGSCHKYGGCPFRHICNLGPAQHLQSLTAMDDTNSLLSRLQKRANEASTSPSVAQIGPGQINPPESTLAPEPTPPDLPPANDGAPQEPGTKDIDEALKAEKRPTRRVPKAQKEKAPQRPIGTLYVNCAPMTFTEAGDITPASRFEQLLDIARATIALTKFRDKQGEPEYEVPDYRFVHFGQGPAVLLASVQQALEQQGRVEELVISDATTPEAQIVLNHLLSRCDRVVRSTR